MSSAKMIALGVVLAVLALLIQMSFFVLDPTKQALVTAFGAVKGKARTEPGLYFKWPWEDVVRMEKRLLHIEAEEFEAIASDQKRLVVDAFARYHITDPLKYYQSTGNNEVTFRSQLGSLINGYIRRELGTVLIRRESGAVPQLPGAVPPPGTVPQQPGTAPQQPGTVPQQPGSTVPPPPQQPCSTVPQPGEPHPKVLVLSEDQTKLMRCITELVNKDAGRDYGVEVVDVRIKRADLPRENSEAVYNRMRTQREQEARQLRAEGDEESQRIKAGADRQRIVLLSEGRKTAETLRGEGDAQAIRIYAEAFGRDPQFFAFYRSMEAYRQALGGGGTTMVLTPDSDFFKYFGNMGGQLPPPPK